MCPWIFANSVISCHLSDKFHKILPFAILILSVLGKNPDFFPTSDLRISFGKFFSPPPKSLVYIDVRGKGSPKKIKKDKSKI
jgi:hypothetical protein